MTEPDYAKLHHEAFMAALPLISRTKQFYSSVIKEAIIFADEYIKQLKERG